MTTDHVEDTHLFFLMGEQLAQARVPLTIQASIRQGRMIALQKPWGGVRGIVVRDVVRRLVARTMAQQLSKAVEAATAPHQYAMSTRAGTECVAHVLQVLTEIDLSMGVCYCFTPFFSLFLSLILSLSPLFSSLLLSSPRFSSLILFAPFLNCFSFFSLLSVFFLFFLFFSLLFSLLFSPFLSFSFFFSLFLLFLV